MKFEKVVLYLYLIIRLRDTCIELDENGGYDEIK